MDGRYGYFSSDDSESHVLIEINTKVHFFEQKIIVYKPKGITLHEILKFEISVTEIACI